MPSTYELVPGWNPLGYKGIMPMPPEGTEIWEKLWVLGDYVLVDYVGGYLDWDKVEYNRLIGYDRIWDMIYSPYMLYPTEGYWVFVPEGGEGSIPGLNDGEWLNALYWDLGWDYAAYEWIDWWRMEDFELAMRYNWISRWYDLWIVGPWYY